MAAGLAGLEYGSDIGGSIRNPAAYCGVYGHKTTWGIVPKRGHQLPRAPVPEADLGSLGPLARSANDLKLALQATVGPDLLSASGVRYGLPAAPKALKDMRNAVWLDDPMAPVDDAVKAPIEAAAEALRKAGAKVGFKARPAFDARQAHHTFMALLAAQVYTRRPDFAQLFWAGLAVCPLLPATAAPVGFTPEGLPVGLQIIDPEMGDLQTIWVASQLERLLGGFQAPPGWPDC